jgi:hypothetical protein
MNSLFSISMFFDLVSLPLNVAFDCLGTLSETVNSFLDLARHYLSQIST